MQKSTSAMVLLIGSIVVLVGFLLTDDFPLPMIVAVHALTFAVASSAGFLLHDQIDASGFSGVMLLLAYASLGITLSGVFFTIMPSAGVLFSVVSIVVIVGVLNSA